MFKELEEALTKKRWHQTQLEGLQELIDRLVDEADALLAQARAAR